MKKSLFWILLHSSLLIFTLCNLVTGLRIATITKPWLMSLSWVLPQGLVHHWHLISAIGLTTVFLLLVVKQIISKSFNKTVIIWTGYLILMLMVLTGWLLQWNQISNLWHFYLALFMFAYIVYHSGEYIVLYGLGVFKTIILPKPVNFQAKIFIGVFIFTSVSSFGFYQIQKSTIVLNVHIINNSAFIDIDGMANEAEWENIKPVKILTIGGDNFNNGTTTIEVKALANELDFFVYFRWQDDSQSLNHLPLYKTKQGWVVKQTNFANFDESTFYEDKFAVLFSNTCKTGGDQSAHLGPKPFADKPANWHGKGFHASSNRNIKDMWHWKAVRSNPLTQADDGYIGLPDHARSAKRRYSAGNFYDPKESGGYLMNWQWFSIDTITPRRLPSKQEALAKYQNTNQATSATWYDHIPYQGDDFSYGTYAPSVIFTSNQYEGDRGNVRAKGIWQDGYWHLEMSRQRIATSNKDLTINDNMCMWASAFDHSQIGHTRHNKPMKLNFKGDL